VSGGVVVAADNASLFGRRFDRIGIKYIGDCRFYALFNWSLCFFWRT